LYTKIQKNAEVKVLSKIERTFVCGREGERMILRESESEEEIEEENDKSLGASARSQFF